jgi:hypothetical protein
MDQENRLFSYDCWMQRGAGWRLTENITTPMNTEHPNKSIGKKKHIEKAARVLHLQTRTSSQKAAPVQQIPVTAMLFLPAQETNIMFRLSFLYSVRWSDS